MNNSLNRRQAEASEFSRHTRNPNDSVFVYGRRGTAGEELGFFIRFREERELEHTNANGTIIELELAAAYFQGEPRT
jgi:hypothetical protein